ncbi:hypothetical protein BDY19DRAFT_944691 [Irpex rosettiformis]|uniref:Uncharacterized protein n=1 Tax=Irpex rosettiformis TaxID=378272 RepID=A0ACB8U4K9_9APHY|nr:hypothetical protein BDY19DRAFT_944691 [Irpex rosettiformis]
MGSPATITYGPIFIGMTFNILLYGIMITQTYLYFDSFKRDKLWIKLFVILLFLCDTLNSAFDISFVYIPLVNNFGNINALSYASWIFSTDPAMTAIIACMVQTFFAWRVKVLSGSWILVLCIVSCSVCQCLGGLATSIACRIIPEFIYFQKFEVVVIIWLSCSAAADMFITISLVWHLRKHKTGLIGTDDMVNRVIKLTVQTGMITTVCAIVDLVLFLVTPAGLHLIFNLPLSKLYTNSLMSTLNSRRVFLSSQQQYQHQHQHLNSPPRLVRFGASGSGSGSGGGSESRMWTDGSGSGISSGMWMEGSESYGIFSSHVKNVSHPPTAESSYDEIGLENVGGRECPPRSLV